MIVYDKEQKQIVIPNGIGNIDIYNNGVEAGYNQGQADMVAKARVLNVTENGNYLSKFSDPIMPTTVTGVYADGTKFYNYASVRDNIFNTKIAATTDSRLEFWYKGEKPESGDKKNIIIGAGDEDNIHCFEVSYNDNNNILRVQVGTSSIGVSNWDDTVWHHLIISKAEGLWIDGKKKGDFLPLEAINGEFFINGINYNVSSSSANGYFGMIKIDDTTIIPTADGFLNTNTGELLEVVKGNGSYKLIENPPIYGEGDLYKTIIVDVPDLAAEARVLNVTENGVYRSRYSDPIVPEIVTGVYDDGTDFYSYANLGGDVFNTKIAATIDSRLEFWYKGDNTSVGFGDNVIIGAGNNDDNNCFQVRYYEGFNGWVKISVGNSTIDINNWDDKVWHHLIISKSEGLWVDGEKKGDFTVSNTVNGEFFINGIGYDNARNANGSFGMIKIDDTTIIPAVNGFLNTNTGEMLEKVKKGAYVFWGEEPFYPKGALYKTINVNIDVDSYYNNGYNQGKTDGINEQKGKLESISITENGTYSKEDGYNHIEVNVPDLNGSYDEGYEQGQADVAANARVLNVTENGNYLSKFSDPFIPTDVTGVYADGTDFYSYAELDGISYDSGFIVSEDMKVEIWWKGDVSKTDKNLFGSQVNNNYTIFKIRIPDTAYRFDGEIAMRQVTYLNAESNRWYHFKISYADGFWVDGVKIGDFSSNISGTPYKLYINSNTNNIFNGANGYFGMIKITTNGVENIIIPTAEGLKNITTDEMLQVAQNGNYTFTEKLPIYPEGELYKTINVNVVPKINPQKAGLRLGYSIFTEIPEWLDFNGITDMSYMFYDCSNLQTIPLIDTSKVTNMHKMFDGCSNLQTIPLIDTSNVTNMGYMFYDCGNLQTIPLIDTSNVTNMGYMFYYCSNLQTIPLIDTSNVTNMEYMFGFCHLTTIPQLDTSNVTNMVYMFYGCSSLVSLPALDVRSLESMSSYSGIFGYGELSKLTDFGGFLNLKCSLTGDGNLKILPNLTKESCINVLNGLYDFVAAGETPNSNQGKLKVHQNFLDKVGDEISIGVAKGWTITA